MHKTIKIICLVILFIGFFIDSFGQEIVTSNSIWLNTKNRINKIYENHVWDGDIVLLADSRKLGELDILIVVLNQNKEVIREQIIGMEKIYERPIGLIKNSEGYFLCANSVKNGRVTFDLYELDETFAPKNHKSIPINNLSGVTAIQYDANNRNLIFTATVTDLSGNMYPRLVRYDLVSHTVIQDIHLNNHTDEKILLKGNVIVGVNEKTNKVIVQNYDGSKKYKPLSKECNQIKCLNDNCSEVLLVGQEISVNFTDFWVTKIKDNRIVWEKIYKTRKGGDVAMDVFFDKESKNILVGGVGYNKNMREKHDFNYSYRVLQLDEDGEFLKGHAYKSKYESSSRSMYLQTQQIGTNYLISGHTEQKINISKSIRENDVMTPSDLYLVLVNKDGALQAEKVLETQSVDIPYSSVVLSEQKMLLIFSKDEEIEILELKIM